MNTYIAFSVLCNFFCKYIEFIKSLDSNKLISIENGINDINLINNKF